MIKINGFNADETKLFLRTSNNGVSHNGFKRKPVGQWNNAGDKWTGTPNCKKCGGFFGINKDYNSYGVTYKRRTLELCEWRGKLVPIDNSKICVKSYRVLATNSRIKPEWIDMAGGHGVKDGEIVVSGHNNFAVNVKFAQKGSNSCVYAYGKSENTQYDGECYIHGRTVVTQYNGECHICNESVNTQYGGACHMFDKSVNTQYGGQCWMRDNARVVSHGGECYSRIFHTPLKRGGG